MSRKRLTNVQLVKQMMERSQHGALMQAFVMEALSKYANACAAATPETFDSPMLSGAAWHGCAVELQAALAAHFAD